MGAIYDINPRYKMKFHARMQFRRREAFCFVHTQIALLKFRNLQSYFTGLFTISLFGVLSFISVSLKHLMNK